jgi:hypothetical protein
MRDAARRTTCSSCLGEARVLAPACPLHALCSGPCRLELTWCSHPLGTVCLRRARCRSPCRLELPCYSPPLCTVCPRHARYSAERPVELPWCSLLLAPFAAAVRDAIRRAATNRPLGTALQLTLPPAHRSSSPVWSVELMSSRNPSGFPPCGKSTVQGGESHHRSARENFQYTHSYRCGSSSRPHLWRDANPEARGVFVTPLLVLTLHRVRQGALQECTDLLEGSRERSNSHELSTTRLSVGGGKRSGVHSATRNLPLSSRGALHTTRQWPSTAHCTEREPVWQTPTARDSSSNNALRSTHDGAGAVTWITHVVRTAGSLGLGPWRDRRLRSLVG